MRTPQADRFSSIVALPNRASDLARGQQHRTRRSQQQNECQFDRIKALEPARRIKSRLCRGFHGAAIPGCPETFQSSRQNSRDRRESSEDQQQKDQHQKVRQVREGDVVALPAGVADWFYNNGDSPLVLVQLLDTSNAANQLDQDFRNSSKEAQTREANMKAKVEEASRKDIATSSVASTSDYSQKLSTPQEIRGGRARTRTPKEQVVEQCLENHSALQLKHNINNPEMLIFNPQLSLTTVNSSISHLAYQLCQRVSYPICYITRGSEDSDCWRQRQAVLMDKFKRSSNYSTTKLCSVKKQEAKDWSGCACECLPDLKEDARKLKNNRMKLVFSVSITT
uniref:Cupin type-1 domain-containing protein n=1 Tax=Salix viminalis TaxID=40686 RepID=A0A6N2ME16_SALVM